MSEKIREVSTIPDPSLGRKLAQSGHSFYEAIAELIDNSFDARATDIDIDITNAQDAKHNITISDNGLGMNLKELTSAITLAKSAKSSDNGDLGLFGLGMKTSLGALGMLHEIETSKKGSAKRFIYRNNDNIPKTEHKAEIVERDDAPKNSSYTIVRIGDLKFLTKDKISVLKEKTAKRYSKILDNGYTTLTINNTKIDAISVEFNKNVSQINGTITYNGNLYNYLFGYVAQNTGTYGVSLYKNMRIIEEEKKDIMGLKGRHQHERGIYGEVFLNDFDTDHQKTQFLRTDQWYEFEKLLKKDPQVMAFRREALKYNGTTKEATPVAKETEKKIQDILKKMGRHINNNKLLDDLNFNSIEKSADENDIAKIVPDASPPPSDPKEEKLKPTGKSTGSGTRSPNPSIKWKAGGVVFDIKHHVEDLHNIDCIKTWDLVNDTTLNVIINNAGRVYNGIQETTAFITQEIVDAFIRCLMEKKEVPYARAFDLRDNILNGAHL